MIQEDYVSFEVAKLLKEKDFNESCYCVYFMDNLEHNDYSSSNFELVDNAFTAPTHQMALKWLREVHNILIVIIPMEIKIGVERLCYGIYRITEDLYQPLYNGKINNLVDSYEELVEAALKYTLENLI